MTAKEVREKYIRYFTNPFRNHTEIEPASLVLHDDGSTLFTSAGMQPLVPYLLGKPHPMGKRLVNTQPSIRLQDIEEVGDNRHTTFFEMLGNWSLGDYFKKDQLPWIYDFFTKELGLAKEKLWVSVFEGDKNVPKDMESYELWKKLGIPDERIYFYGTQKNWWSMTGSPDEMQVGHIGGPDSEIFYDFGEELKIHEKSPYKEQKCHPNCECGRFLEIGNSVFIQYKKVSDTKLEELPQKNVDFGGGLERVTAAINGNSDVFRTDLFAPTISNLEEFTGVKYGTLEKTDKNFRIIADHMRAALYITAEGVTPSNKLHGYVARRLIRRSVFRLKLLGFELGKGAISTLVRDYVNNFDLIKNNWPKVKDQINIEAVKFGEALERGLKKLNLLMSKGKIDGRIAFDLYQTEGFPLELTLEILEENGMSFSDIDRKVFEDEFDKHKNLSRTTSAGVFKGGLADDSREVACLHTAAHLLLASLRKVLGDQIVQKGQNITKDRARFDFPYSRKLTGEEVKKVEDMINDVIKKDLPVNFIVMSKEEALATGAIHTFNEKYADTVKVYFVGNSLEASFSKEFCGGPHVKKTSEIGRVKINKHEKIGADLIRIYLTAENG